MGEISIRRAEARDLRGIARLLEQILEVHAKGRPDLFRSGGRKYTDEEISALLEDPSRVVLVADLEGTVAGYAICIWEEIPQSHALYPVKTLYLDDLCVDEDLRGRGVGSLLYDRVVEYARKEGAYRVTLNVWSFNSSAAGFYEKKGLLPLKTTLEQIL